MTRRASRTILGRDASTADQARSHRREIMLIDRVVVRSAVRHSRKLWNSWDGDFRTVD